MDCSGYLSAQELKVKRAVFERVCSAEGQAVGRQQEANAPARPDARELWLLLVDSRTKFQCEDTFEYKCHIILLIFVFC